MNKSLSLTVALLFVLFFNHSCTTSKAVSSSQPITANTKAASEFRAAWVATVANINWPSKPGLSTKEQQQEAIELLNFLQKHNFNAVILQVRPQCDALYKSNLEPWSYYLTGKQGKAPDPYYDPLEYWIEEAHNRGLELHVWLNPYRAHHPAEKEVSDQSIVKTKPELAVYLKEGYWWLDPAKKGTQDHSSAVVMDLVKRYDIDGVHFDDYFYPYPSYNLNEDFPDNESWIAYQKSGGKLSRGDWRRQSVNEFIERLYKQIKQEKPFVKFGLSPFGIWRPGYPESIAGFDQYDKLYADAKLWLNKGWIDYFAPQLYWTINTIPQSYPVLLGWWAGENTQNRHLWPGINVYHDTLYKNVDETINQIMIDRGIVPQSKGVIHWSISSVVKNTKLAEALLTGPYRKPALVPASPWLDNKAPEAPVVANEVLKDQLKITWTPKDEKDAFRYVVYYRYGNNWQYEIVNRKERSFNVKLTTTVASTATPLNSRAVTTVTPLNAIAVTAVDRVGNESERKEIALTP